MIAAASRKLPIDRRAGRTSKRPSRAEHDLLNQRTLTPEKTPAGKEHVRLFKAWVLNMNRETFREFIRSPYC